MQPSLQTAFTKPKFDQIAAVAAAVLVYAAIAGSDYAQQVGLGWPAALPSDGSIAIYLASAMLVHALILTGVVVAFRRGIETVRRPAYETPFARLSLLLVPFVFLSLVSGALETISGELAWAGYAHRAMVGISSLLLAWVWVIGWRTQRFRPGTLVMLTVTAILFLTQVLVGAVMSLREPGLALIALHSVTGPAVWAAVIVLAVHVGLERLSPESEGLSAFRASSLGERVRDYLTLTKPVIVLLLLATTLAGMVVGLRAWPSPGVIFWTLLGGALAAGGSGAINQYIDRDVDALMKRTARRPLAAGRMTPAEGLAFGVGLCLSAFYLLAVFTNFLAAALSVAGMIYYVWLYSLVLKKATVQNIVIGGGAGAIPPLVGWAAATGSLTLPALLLFVIIFFWTPPHFWALALVRAKDYARGGIPMLPVVRGEAETRKQILIYTVVLVAITLTAPLVELAGGIYLLGAAVLGAALIAVAWQLWRAFTPKLAWRMYRWSSMYLFFLFALMMADALL